MRPRIFLDTNILLSAFASWRAGGSVTLCLVDEHAERFTFQKCVFEAYLAFRGVGGKKPDEGRARWAQSHLKAAEDPKPLGTLASKYHDGDLQSTHFWINQIDGLRFGGLDHEEEAIQELVLPEDIADALSETAVIRELAANADRYSDICREFVDFLSAHKVTVAWYQEVFDIGMDSLYGGSVNQELYFIDSLVKESAIPSEDFEIVFAAMRISADIFVTEDKRLITSSYSLGFNNEIGAWTFCLPADYSDKVAAWKLLNTGCVTEDLT